MPLHLVRGFFKFKKQLVCNVPKCPVGTSCQSQLPQGQGKKRSERVINHNVLWNVLPPLPCRPEKGLTFCRYLNPTLHDASRGKYNTTHNLQKLLPFTVPWFPYLYNMNMNSHKMLVAKKKKKKPKCKTPPTTITIQRYGHIFYFTHGSGRINSLTATENH